MTSLILKKYATERGLVIHYDTALVELIKEGDKVTGITIHLANMEYDEGPIIYQREVPVLEGDSLDDLETRIHAA